MWSATTCRRFPFDQQPARTQGSRWPDFSTIRTENVHTVGSFCNLNDADRHRTDLLRYCGQEVNS